GQSNDRKTTTTAFESLKSSSPTGLPAASFKVTFSIFLFNLSTLGASSALTADMRHAAAIRNRHGRTATNRRISPSCGGRESVDQRGPRTGGRYDSTIFHAGWLHPARAFSFAVCPRASGERVDADTALARGSRRNTYASRSYFIGE